MDQKAKETESQRNPNMDDLILILMCIHEKKERESK